MKSSQQKYINALQARLLAILIWSTATLTPNGNTAANHVNQLFFIYLLARRQNDNFES